MGNSLNNKLHHKAPIVVYRESCTKKAFAYFLSSKLIESSIVFKRVAHVAGLYPSDNIVQ